MSVSLPSSLKYSLYWSQSVVDNALDKHARVSEAFIKFTGLSRKQLAFLLASGRPEWALLRDLLKVADNWCTRQEMLGIKYGSKPTIQMWSALIALNRTRYPEKLRLYLDKQIKCAILE